MLQTPSKIVSDYVVVDPINTKWQSLAQKNNQGVVVQSYLGDPVADQSVIPTNQGGGTAQYFQRGMIVAKTNRQACVVYGMIYVRYRDLGGLGGALGQPISDEEDAAGGGRVSHFEKGDIFWHPSHGAHEVRGLIYQRYKALGSSGGVLGYPTTGETPVTDDKKKEIGAFNRFANNGAIYWSLETGAWEVYGMIREAWETQYKGVKGPLGFPIAEQTTLPAVKDLPETVYGSFKTGALVWQDRGRFMGANMVNGLDVYVESFNAKGSHGLWESIGVAGNNLYVNVNIKASNGQHLADRMPANGDYGKGRDIQQNIFSIPVVRGDLTFDVSFEGVDRRPSSGDEVLGRAGGTYNARNLWGINQPTTGWQGDFDATFDIKPHNLYNRADFRQEMFWGFLNVGTPDLSWDEFAETFSDVSFSEDNTLGHVEHPFDYLFYKWVFEGLAKNGNCFGMCVESIYAQVGRSLFAEPIVTYPWAGPETQEVNIKMGYQLGGDFIDWFLGQFVAGNTHNPVNAFNTSLEQFNSGNYPVISLTTNSLFADGHCVRPYAWFNGNFPGKPGALVIKVANPNSPAAPPVQGSAPFKPVPDDDPSCLIVINKASNTYELLAASPINVNNPTVYAGGEWSGGRMFSIPFGQFSSQPRTPFWEVFSLLVGGTLIIFGGDAQIKQITDGSGKTFYEPNLTHPPTNWEDIRKDASQRINMTRIPFHGATVSGPSIVKNPQQPLLHDALASLGHLVAPPSQPELYYLRGDGGSLNHEIIGKKSGTAQWHVRSATLGAVVTLPVEAGKTDLIHINDTGSSRATVTLTTAANGSPKSAVVSMADGRDTQAPQFTLNNFRLAPGHEVTFGLDPKGKNLTVENAGPSATFDLTIRQGSNARTYKGITLDSQNKGVLSPADASAPAQVHLQVLDRSSGAVLNQEDLQ
jgi:LGFP repeat